ncbi:sensor histidine kinase [Streptococcus caprae]|uniref:histidine kinase n=1 Tax=Streptococcus caprae TaxID=1640501 RepID=A0ABV8CXH6_9STRE
MKVLNKIRLQFILIASLAIMAVLASFIIVFNSVRYVSNNAEVSTVLSILVDNDGEIPSNEELDSALEGTGLSAIRASQLFYFSFVLDDDNTLISSQLNEIKDLSESDIAEIMTELNYSKGKGTIKYEGHYYAYQIAQKKTGKLVVVLDATANIDDRSDLLWTSLQMSAYSFLFFILIVFVFSGRAIKPYIDNIENQKSFITNAGHELKTPLAIISANTEMQELLDGETEWTKSTKDQTKRLTDLINSMVTLAKMEEQLDIVLTKCDFSAIAEDAAEDFKGPVIKDGKIFEMVISPGVMVNAEEKSLFELVTILVDNANKYCDPGGTVRVTLNQTGFKRARLEVSNTFAKGEFVDYSKFFDRFYREDESRSNKVKGYGIGLSMAASMVQIFKGKISAHYKDGRITFRVILP